MATGYCSNTTDTTVWYSYTTAATTLTVTVNCVASGTSNWYYAVPSTDAPAAESAPRVRALELLREMLSETERAEMESERVLTVESKSSKRRYRIRTDAERHGNIEQIDEKGRVVATLCCAPRGGIPIEDALLGQKLALEYHHVIGDGTSRKADACWIVPLCWSHHREVHNQGSVSFGRKYGLNLAVSAVKVERAWLAFSGGEA